MSRPAEIFTYGDVRPHRGIPSEIPLARAQAHLMEGRPLRAICTFRGLLAVDPTAIAAHFGLADAMAAVGRCEQAVDELVEAAEALAERGAHAEGMSLYAKALALAPERLDLHLDLAFIEQVMGRHEAARRRVEWLAERYADQGRHVQAIELLRFADSWGEDDGAQERPGPVASPMTEPPFARAPLNTAFISGATVVARNPLLPEIDEFAAAPSAVARVVDDLPVWRETAANETSRA